MSSPEAGDEAATSCDGFMGGRFHLVQPVAGGFRAGLDALLLAACVGADWYGEALDAGAGTGAVALGAAVRAPALSIRLLERDPAVATLARRTLLLCGNAALAPRLSLCEGDLLSGAAGRAAAGLPDARFDAVLTNPPFHPPGSRESASSLRRDAKALSDGQMMGEWMRACAALLRTRGRLVLVARPENLADILGAASGRLGDLAIVPVHPREGEPARRILVGAVRGSRAPLRLLPGLELAEADGTPSAAARAIATGHFHVAGLFRAALRPPARAPTSPAVETGNKGDPPWRTP